MEKKIKNTISSVKLTLLKRQEFLYKLLNFILHNGSNLGILADFLHT